MTGGQAVPAANGPITQKQPLTLMQVRLYLILFDILIKIRIICIFYIFFGLSVT